MIALLQKVKHAKVSIDKKLYTFLKYKKVKVFAGSEKNVLSRYAKASA